MTAEKREDIMSFAEFHFRSACLDRETAVNVILPNDLPAGECPVVTLLHGMHGSYDNWMRKSNIETLAFFRKIAVVMPEGNNSYYQDMVYGERFFSYISEELPAVMRRTFGFSADREKNYIAGLSMGGYGAMRTALLLPERYTGAASLSGALDMVRWIAKPQKVPYAIRIWGEDYAARVPGSDADLFHLFRTFPKDKPAPKLFFACGTEDALYQAQKDLVPILESRKDVFDYTVKEGPGVHNWLFWNEWIGPALDAILPS